MKIFILGIQLLVQGSGDWNDEQTWCGGFIPVPSICLLNGGCQLIVPPSLTLTITDIDDQLSLAITKWIIDGDLLLGSSDLSTGFYFGISCEVIVNNGGSLISLSTGTNSGMYFPENSTLIVDATGILEGQTSPFLYSYESGDLTHIIGEILFDTTILSNSTAVVTFTFGSNSSSYNVSNGINNCIYEFS